MEHFSNEEIFLEQVGFFYKVLSLSSTCALLEGSQDETSQDNSSISIQRYQDTQLKCFFLETLGYDIQFWREMEYLISDMNCFVTHLLQVSFLPFWTF